MDDFDQFVAEKMHEIESAAGNIGFYMPAIATLLRIAADEFADRYPDDTNGGVLSDKDDRT